MRETGAGETRADFRVEAEYPRPGTVIVTVYGEADLHVAPELRASLSAAIERASAVVVDLSSVSFVDSTVLGVLVRSMKRARSRGGLLRVVAPRAELRRIFEITLLDRVLELHASPEDALAATARPDGSRAT